MNFFEPEYEDLHADYEQLRRQKSAMDLKMDYVNSELNFGIIKNYRVFLEGCTCTDFSRRQKPCKHMYCLAMELGVFEVDEEKIKSLQQKDSSSNEVGGNIQMYPVHYEYITYDKPPEDYVVIDFETANNRADSICQMGMAVVKNNAIIEEKSYLIRPPYNDFRNSRIHGIKLETVRSAGTFREIWSEIKPYIENQMVAAYNLPFDLSCLFATLHFYGIDEPSFYAFDILSYVKTCCYYKSYKLTEVAKRLKFKHKAHDAASDAKVAAEIQILVNEHFSGVKTNIYYLGVQALFSKISHSQISMEEILTYTKELIKTEEELNYEQYKDLLKLLEQVAAKNECGILYQNCGMLYERFGKIVQALSFYKTALSLDKKLKLKTRIEKLEKAVKDKNKNGDRIL